MTLLYKKIFLVIIVLMFSFVAIAQTAPTISRKSFTSDIGDREPVDTLKSILAPGQEQIDAEDSLYYFTELMNFQDTDVKHVWKLDDHVVYELSFTVKGPRWRVNSKMKLANFKAGDVITVDVVGTDGSIYSTETIVVKQ